MGKVKELSEVHLRGLACCEKAKAWNSSVEASVFVTNVNAALSSIEELEENFFTEQALEIKNSLEFLENLEEGNLPTIPGVVVVLSTDDNYNLIAREHSSKFLKVIPPEEYMDIL